MGLVTTGAPVAFLYPFPLTTAMEPWREALGENYDRVIAVLAEREYALENYLRADLTYTTAFDNAVLTQIQTILAQFANRAVFAEITTSEGTAAGGPVDLATDGPSVTVDVGTSGKLIVQGGFACSVAATGASASMHFDLDAGAQSIGRNAFSHNFGAGSGGPGVSRTVQFTGLSAGSHTIKLRYGSSGGITSTFSGRFLLAQGL